VRILLIDNNDSFTRNLEHLLVSTCSNASVQVLPYSELTRIPQAELVVISPGPGAPCDYPGYGPLLDSGVPVLGVCLGMQIINEHFGGETARHPHRMHGKTDRIHWRGRDWTVARYHSLRCSCVAKELCVEAELPDSTPMILSHENRPLLGLQFHPESFMTTYGTELTRHALHAILSD